jgi:hypothetical protein
MKVGVLLHVQFAFPRRAFLIQAGLLAFPNPIAFPSNRKVAINRIFCSELSERDYSCGAAPDFHGIPYSSRSVKRSGTPIMRINIEIIGWKVKINSYSVFKIIIIMTDPVVRQGVFGDSVWHGTVRPRRLTRISA